MSVLSRRYPLIKNIVNQANKKLYLSQMALTILLYKLFSNITEHDDRNKLEGFIVNSYMTAKHAAASVYFPSITDLCQVSM